MAPPKAAVFCQFFGGNIGSGGEKYGPAFSGNTGWRVVSSLIQFPFWFKCDC
jgi:hypothetical protein